jgi:hypothetical protein
MLIEMGIVYLVDVRYYMGNNSSVIGRSLMLSTNKSLELEKKNCRNPLT